MCWHQNRRCAEHRMWYFWHQIRNACTCIKWSTVRESTKKKKAEMTDKHFAIWFWMPLLWIYIALVLLLFLVSNVNWNILLWHLSSSNHFVRSFIHSFIIRSFACIASHRNWELFSKFSISRVFVLFPYRHSPIYATCIHIVFCSSSCLLCSFFPLPCLVLFIICVDVLCLFWYEFAFNGSTFALAK